MTIRHLIYAITLPILLMGGQWLFAQEKPYWTHGFYYEAPFSYIEVVDATSWSEDDAEKIAKEKIIERRSLATGESASVNFEQGKSTTVSHHDLIVNSKTISKYVEKIEPGVYKVYLLQQTKKNPKYEYDVVQYKDNYPFSARCFVPGWQQFYKGSPIKGGIIIGAEAIGVGGIVTCFSLKSSYNNLCQEDPKHAKEYSYRANTWQNIGYGCIAFAAAVYVYNIIDAIAAPGEKRIFVNNTIAFAPVITHEGIPCLAMKYNF